MTSKDQIIRSIARELCALDHPNVDPDSEIELSGSAAEGLVTRSEGAGMARIHFGPAYAHYWKEAQRLAIAVEVANASTD